MVMDIDIFDPDHRCFIVLGVLSFIVLFECLILGPHPKNMKPRRMVQLTGIRVIVDNKTMTWDQFNELSKDWPGEQYQQWSASGRIKWETHPLNEYREAEWDVNIDGCPIWDSPARDLVYLVLLALSWLGTWRCFVTFMFGMLALREYGVLPPDVPATDTCVIGLPLFLGIFIFFCASSLIKKIG